MRDKGKVLIITSFWLILATLVILSLAGIISPQKAVSGYSRASLQAPATVPAGTATRLTIDLDSPSKELHASLSLDNGNRSAVIGALDLPGNMEDLAIDRERQLAFLANSFSGVQIADISDPQHIALVGVITTPGNAWDILTRGELLIVAAAQGGLQIIDTSAPDNPVRVGALELQKKPLLKLAIHGNTLYASSGKNGLFIIDLSDIESPRLIDTVNQDEGVWGVKVANNHLFLTSGKHNLETFSLADPHQPARVNRQKLPGRVWEMNYVNGHLYVPTREEGLFIFDAGNPAKLKLVAQSSTRIDVETIAVEGNIALMTNRKTDIYIYDISNPAMPVEVLASDLAYRPRNIVLVENLAFIASGMTGLQVFDLDRIPRQSMLTSLYVPGNLKQVVFDDSYYYLATGKHGLFVARQEEPDRLPEIIASLPLPGIVLNMVRSGNHLYIACLTAGLQIVDVSDPRAPKQVGQMNHPGNIRDITISGNNLYMAAGKDGLLIANTTFPENPLLVGQLAIASAEKVVIKRDRAYIASPEDGLHIIDISTPSSPFEISQKALPWPLQDIARIHQLTVVDQQVYLAAGEAELIIFDISNENYPEIAGIYHIDGETMAVAAIGEEVYVTTRQGRLWIMARDKEGLKLRGVTDILGSCHNIKFQGEKLILANGLKGLTILDKPQQLNVQLQGEASRSRSMVATINIPPQSLPGVYNLSLIEKRELREFYGALKVTEEKTR
jgi:hypothetical protein